MIIEQRIFIINFYWKYENVAEVQTISEVVLSRFTYATYTDHVPEDRDNQRALPYK